MQSECNVEKEKYGRRYTKLGKTLCISEYIFSEIRGAPQIAHKSLFDINFS